MLNPNLALPILTASKADSTVKRVKPYWLSNNPFTRSSLSWLKGLDRNSYRWLSCIALKRDSSEWATQHTLLQLTARAFYSVLSCRSLNSQLHCTVTQDWVSQGCQLLTELFSAHYSCLAYSPHSREVLADLSFSLTGQSSLVERKLARIDSLPRSCPAQNTKSSRGMRCASCEA